MDTLLDSLAPHLAEMLGLALVAIAGWTGQAIRRHLGLRAEAILRDALHSALRTGVNAAMAEGLDGRRAIDSAVTHVVERGAPDAVAAFALDGAALRRMAGAYLPSAAART